MYLKIRKKNKVIQNNATRKKQSLNISSADAIIERMILPVIVKLVPSLIALGSKSIDFTSFIIFIKTSKMSFELQ
jgi:hypothetical protein